MPIFVWLCMYIIYMWDSPNCPLYDLPIFSHTGLTFESNFILQRSTNLHIKNILHDIMFQILWPIVSINIIHATISYSNAPIMYVFITPCCGYATSNKVKTLNRDFDHKLLLLKNRLICFSDKTYYFENVERDTK